ncbi:hypothetical protein J7W08_11290 [Methanococcoides orientis]|uniref:hypothetical protein n=1 Tax=Methanococcoides orientis TaxID=2822137 RepID=UPI001E37CB08|nr:hypothetical protein [Methanococcoides orientis]UGV40620.1 hypothetical protein J7W08_11290 [Methanococcoides orientis]
MNLLQSMSNWDKSLVEKFALIFPYLILCVILIGYIAAFYIGRPDFAIRGCVIGIPGIIAAIVLTKMHGSGIKTASLNFAMDFDQKRLSMIFFILYALSSVIVITSSIRPWYYFVTISLLYTIILFQIFSKTVNQNLVLSEIILCMINLVYSLTLKNNLYFGGTDILGHLFMSQVTYLSGHTIPESLSLGYANFPLFHILMAQASYLLNLDITTSYFLISPPIFTISVIFLFYIFLNTTKNIKLSLLSVVLFSTLSTVVYYEMYVVTRVVAFIAFLVLMYLIYKNSEKKNPNFKILGILFTLFIVLVHQVSTPQIIAIMILFLVSELILTHFTGLNSKFYNNNYILLLIVTFLGYWFYVADSFTTMLLSTREASLSSESIAIKETVQVGNEWIFIANNVDTMILALFVFIGIGATLWKYGKKYSAVFVLVSLFALPLYLPNPLQTLWQTMILFRFDRFMLLVSPFIAFSMASGFFFCYKLLIIKNRKVISAFLIVTMLFSGFVYSSLIDGSPEYEGTISSRPYFFSDELIGFNFVSDFVPNDSTLYSDRATSRFFPPKVSEFDDFGIKHYRIKKFDVLNFSLKNGYFILRNKALDRGIVFDSMVINDDNILEWEGLNSNLKINNKIYSNSAIDIYEAA